ncbi:hypothetical protein O6H91_Y438800 [Diphasiastrum complanatum]|nr:hypothetical protein O6H91_Y438800 [Diphasiastrum complanatum]
MADRQGSGGASYAAISVVLLAIVHCAMAATYTVGGTAGWNLNVDYKTWAAPITFKVGDTLLFKYSAEAHSVFQVSQANYKTCTISNFIKSYQTGSDSITLTDATTQYFICGTPNHCSSGMAVTVAVSGGSTPSPAPTVSPAPKVSPLPSPPKPVPSPSPSPIAPSPSKTNRPAPSPSETIPSPSPSETIPSPSSETSPSSPPSTPPPGSETPSSPTSPQAPPTSMPSSAPSTLYSGTVVLLSAIFLGGFSLFY